MGDTNTGKGAESFVKLDPHSIQDALRLFFQPTSTGDSRRDFYSAYQKESAEYDHNFVRQCDEYLNTSLIFAGLFSTLCSAFVIELEKKLEPDPTAYLQAILQTLQEPNSTGNPPSPIFGGPLSTHVNVSILLYTSLSTSLLAAFLAMVGKQWLNRYIRHQGGSVAERCEDRQRKLDGLKRWRFRIIVESPPVLLQLSLFLLVVGLSLYLWRLQRTVAWVVIASAIPGAVFYVGIVFIGALSYDCPFQTPLSLILRSLRPVNHPTEKPEPDPAASCVFWVLDRITDPGVVTVALKQLTNLRWHYGPSEKVPLSQVSRIYMKCFNVGHHLISEYRSVAHTAGSALIHLYVHQMCSGGGLDHNHQDVIDALDHLSDTQHDNTLQLLSTIVKSVREPGRGSGYQWEMDHFDLPWVSELWMYHVWLCQNRPGGHRVGGLIAKGGILDSVRALFEKEASPPPGVVRNILCGLLAGVSSSPLPLDDLLSLRRNGLTDGFFARLGTEMTMLVDHNLRALQITLGALVSWKHSRVEIVVMCCNLLQNVAKHTVEEPLVRNIVYLLCRIAFRYPVPGIRTRSNPLKKETIDGLHSFIHVGEEDFINDLMSFFTYASWSEESKDHILRAILRMPASGLSETSQATIITMLGTARWSLVEGFDRGELGKLVGRLPADMVVERIIDDWSVRMGLMRLLLFITFRPLPTAETKPLWKILLHIPPRAPHLFSHDLQDYPNHTDPVQVSLASFSSSHSSEEHRKREETLWMRLFWCSRFFEMGCTSWSKFSAGTDELRQRRPTFFHQLAVLCFKLEGEAQANPDPATVRTKAYTEMSKLLGRVQSTAAGDTRPGPDTPVASPSTRVRRQNSILSRTQDNSPPPPTGPPASLPPPSPSQERSEPSTRVIGDGNQPGEPPDSLAVTPRDTPPTSPTIGRRNSIQPQKDSSPPSPTTSTGPVMSLPPPPQERSEPPIPVTDDGNQPVPIQSGPGSGEPSDPLVVTPRDTPLASPTAGRRNSIQSQKDSSFPPPTGPAVSLPPPPPSQERSEPPMPVTDEGNQQPVSLQSGPGSGKPPGSLAVAPIDTPPADPATRRQNSTGSKIQDSLRPHLPASTEQVVSLPQPQPLPPSQKRSKPPTQVIVDGNQQPVPFQPGPGSGKPSGPLAVAPIDTPPAGLTTRRQNSLLSQIQDSFPTLTTSTGPATSLPQEPQPPPGARSEPPIRMIDGGGQQPVPVRSGPGSGEPPDPFAIAPRDTPPARPGTRRQNSILSQIQDNLPPLPTTSAGPTAPLLQPSQARSEPPIRMLEDGNQQSVPVQSGSGPNEPPDAGPRSVPPPTTLPHVGDEAGSSSDLPLPADNEGD